MHEEWKDIEGYEGIYQVSNFGRVRSISTRRSIHGNIVNIKRQRIIIPHDNAYGYMYVTLHKCKKRKNFYVHRLVAIAFLENQSNYLEVNHIDRNKQNNSLDNLEWVTRIKNVTHSICNMRKPKMNASKTKYIRFRNGKYEVDIPGFRYGGRFVELKKAKEKRDVIVKEYYGR